jgi:hypothetical protein
MSELDKEIREALERAGADDLGQPRARHYREPQPMPDPPSWGPLGVLQPATPWHLVGVGALLWFVAQLLHRAPLAVPLNAIGLVLLAIGVLSLVLLPRPQLKRWRGRLISLDDSWRARLYRRIYRR